MKCGPSSRRVLQDDLDNLLMVKEVKFQYVSGYPRLLIELMHLEVCMMVE